MILKHFFLITWKGSLTFLVTSFRFAAKEVGSGVWTGEGERADRRELATEGQNSPFESCLMKVISADMQDSARTSWSLKFFHKLQGWVKNKKQTFGLAIRGSIWVMFLCITLLNDNCERKSMHVWLSRICLRTTIDHRFYTISWYFSIGLKQLIGLREL